MQGGYEPFCSQNLTKQETIAPFKPDGSSLWNTVTADPCGFGISTPIPWPHLRTLNEKHWHDSGPIRFRQQNMKNFESRLSEERQEFQEIGARLEAAEKDCAGIATREEPEADVARQSLADARYDFTQARLRLVRELEAASLSDPAAARACEVLSRRYLHASAENALAIVGLTAALVRSPEGVTSAPPGSLPEKLQDAIRQRGDSKKSAAGKMRISTKTLDRLLNGDPTKPVKQQAAWRYINSISRSS